jgi:hypothetical protein
MVGVVQIGANGAGVLQLNEANRLAAGGKFNGIMNERPMVSMTKVAGKPKSNYADVCKQTFESFQGFIKTKEIVGNKIDKDEDLNSSHFSLTFTDKKNHRYTAEAYFSKKGAIDSTGNRGYVSVSQYSKKLDGNYDIIFFKDQLQLHVFYSKLPNDSYATVDKMLNGTVIFPTQGNLDNPLFIPKDGTEKDAVALKPIMKKMIADAKVKDKLALKTPIVSSEKKPEAKQTAPCKINLPVFGCADSYLPKNILSYP